MSLGHTVHSDDTMINTSVSTRRSQLPGTNKGEGPSIQDVHLIEDHGTRRNLARFLPEVPVFHLSIIPSGEFIFRIPINHSFFHFGIGTLLC